MKATKTWILIADAKTARIVEHTIPAKGLVQITNKTFSSPQINEYADQEGRSFNSGSGARHKLEAHHGEDPVTRDYISEIIKSLEGSYNDKKFDRLIICAAPSTLGAIRNQLPELLRNVTTAEIAKDLMQIANDELPSHFEDFLVI